MNSLAVVMMFQTLLEVRRFKSSFDNLFSNHLHFISFRGIITVVEGTGIIIFVL